MVTIFWSWRTSCIFIIAILSCNYFCVVYTSIGDQMMPMPNIIARRLKAARMRAGLTQKQLSERLGFKDRQTLAAIESGTRKISADELLLAMRVLGRDLEYFTDPFRLEGEGRFTWRTTPGNTDGVDEFESRAAGWLALYRRLAVRERFFTAPMRIGLTEKDSYEAAHMAAEWLVNEWKLGETPAAALEKAVEKRLRALVLHIDTPEGISGAAFQMPELSAVIINRNESAGRRNFDLAHELFHLLTWDTIRPDHSEDAEFPRAMKRSEVLANCFASALLMPENVVRAHWKRAPRGDMNGWRSWVSESARRFRVTVPALLWRFVQLDLLEKSASDESSEYWSKVHEEKEDKPRRFSLEFVKVLQHGLEEGRVSIRRVSALVGMSIEDLAGLFDEYSLDVPFDI